MKFILCQNIQSPGLLESFKIMQKVFLLGKNRTRVLRMIVVLVVFHFFSGKLVRINFCELIFTIKVIISKKYIIVIEFIFVPFTV